MCCNCVCMFVRVLKRSQKEKQDTSQMYKYYYYLIFFLFLCVFSSWRLEQLWLSWLKINASNSWGPTKQTHTNVHAHMNFCVIHMYLYIVSACVLLWGRCVCVLCARFSTPTPAAMQQQQQRQRQRKQEQQCKIRAQIQLLCFPPVTRDKNQ